MRATYTSRANRSRETIATIFTGRTRRTRWTLKGNLNSWNDSKNPTNRDSYGWEHTYILHKENESYLNIFWNSLTLGPAGPMLPGGPWSPCWPYWERYTVIKKRAVKHVCVCLFQEGKVCNVYLGSENGNLGLTTFISGVRASNACFGKRGGSQDIFKRTTYKILYIVSSDLQRRRKFRIPKVDRQI